MSNPDTPQDSALLLDLLKQQQALLNQQHVLIAEQDQTIKSLTEQLAQLQQKIDKLTHMLFGRKSEKQKHNKESQTGDKTTTSHKSSTPKKNANHNGRNPLSDELSREEIKYDLPETERFCKQCEHALHVMGKTITEQLDITPPKFFVKQHIRYKYKCNCCGEIYTTKMPPQPIDKGLAGPGVLAEVLINKYQDCLPLYRQQQRFERHGISLPMSTLADWISQCAFLLKPIVDYMANEAIIPGKRIFTDDTPMPVQDKTKKGQVHTGRLWTYVGGGQKEPLCVVYEYTKSRSKNAPKDFLKDFTGYLQADAYPGYDALYQGNKVIEVGCWAHARRKFDDVIKIDSQSKIANKAVKFIADLYEIEDKIEHLPPDKIKFFRKRRSKPILKQFRRWLKRKERQLLPKSPTAKAVAYVNNHWRALNNYLRDGTLNIDNNTAERSLRMIVIGRKNYLFAGSHEGAQRAAVLYSIIETCKMHKINTFTYLKDVLTRLPTTLNKDLKELVPYNWVPLSSEKDE